MDVTVTKTFANPDYWGSGTINSYPYSGAGGGAGMAWVGDTANAVGTYGGVNSIIAQETLTYSTATAPHELRVGAGVGGKLGLGNTGSYTYDIIAEDGVGMTFEYYLTTMATINTTRFQHHGTVRVDGLAGTGVRIVTSTADGDLANGLDLSGTGIRMVTADATGALEANLITVTASSIYPSAEESFMTLGSTVDGYKFGDIYRESESTLQHIQQVYSNTAGITTNEFVYRSGGTVASQAAAPTDAVISRTSYYVSDDALGYEESGKFEVSVDGAIAVGDLTTQMTWSLKNGSATMADVMSLSPSTLTLLAGAELDQFGLTLRVGASIGSGYISRDDGVSPKVGEVVIPHFTNAEEDLALLNASSTGTTGVVRVGGGSPTLNTATHIYMMLAADNTTTTGTDIGLFTIDGLRLEGGLTLADGAELDQYGRAITVGADATDWLARTDNVSKLGALVMPQYDIDEETTWIIGGVTTDTTNQVTIGGGGGVNYNTATNIYFMSAANNTTTTPTVIAEIDIDGFHVDTIGEYVPDAGVTINDEVYLPTIGGSGTGTSMIYYNRTDGELTYGDAPSGGSMDYPDAGIALSTGSAWDTSITDNSSNWNTAYTHSGVTTGNPHDVDWNELSGSQPTPVSHTLLSHTITGETSGHVLAANSATTYSIRQLLGSEINNDEGWASYTFGDGLTETGGTVDLGGSATSSMLVDITGNYTFRVEGDTGVSASSRLSVEQSTTFLTAFANTGHSETGGYSLIAANSGSSSFYYYDSSGNPLGLAFNSTTMTVTDLASTKGLVYAGDYSTAGEADDRWIPDWGAVVAYVAAQGSMVYPDAGIALSTGSAWDTSITDNSANWNTAYTHSGVTTGNPHSVEWAELDGARSTITLSGFNDDLTYNNYSHPNHTGQVTSSGDGANTAHYTIISAQSATPSVVSTQTFLLLNAAGTGLTKSTVLQLETYMQDNLSFGGGGDVTADTTLTNNYVMVGTGTTGIGVADTSVNFNGHTITNFGAVSYGSPASEYVVQVSGVVRYRVPAGVLSDITPLTTKGDIMCRSTLTTRLAVGTNGHVLTANSSTATGLEWTAGGEWTADTNGITYADNVGIGVASHASHALYTTGTTSVNGYYNVIDLPVFQMGAGGITDEYLVLCPIYDATLLNACGLNGKITFQRGSTGSGNAIGQCNITLQTAYNTNAIHKFENIGTQVWTTMSIITIAESGGDVDYLALKARTSGGGANYTMQFVGDVYNLGSDPNFLTRVRVSDSDITVVTTNLYFPDVSGVSNNIMRGAFNYGGRTDLGGTTNDVILETQGDYRAGGSNNMYHRIWSRRDATGTNWNTIRLHDAISIDSSFGTPATDTRCWYERDPSSQIHYWGSGSGTYAYLSSGGLVVPTNIFVGDSTAKRTTTHNNAIVIASTGTSESSVLELVGNTTGTDYVGAVSFHNTASTSATERVGELSCERNGDNEAGTMRIVASNTTGSMLVCQEWKHNEIGFWASGNVEMTMTASLLYPNTTLGLALGDATHVWGTSYINRLYLPGLAYTDRSNSVQWNSGGECSYHTDGSDLRFKDVKGPIENASAKLRKIIPFIFTINELGHEKIGWNMEELRYGVSAQATKPEFPHIVKNITVPGAEKYLKVDYEMFAPILIAGHNEHTDELAEMRKEIIELKELINTLLS